MGLTEYINIAKNVAPKIANSARFWGGIKSGKTGQLGGIGNYIGDIASGFGSIIGNKYGEDFSEDQKQMQSMVRMGLSMIPGYGQLISAATGAIDAIGTATGLNLSNLDNNAAERASASGAAKFNNVVNSLPGTSMLVGMLGGRTSGYELSNDAEEMESGYSGTVGNMRAAEELANKRMLFGRHKVNSFIDSATKNDQILSQINTTNTMRKQSDYYQDLQHQNINRYAGQNYLNTVVGKSGMKLMSITDARRIVALKNNDLDITKLQNGGEIPGIDTSVIPEGALHARKNNLSDLNEDLEDATKKGIPVMEANNGVVEGQIAEVEKEEIIFRLEITKQLEELRDDGSEEAMIEAGKLIANELITNTQDNAGIIMEDAKNGE